MVTHAAALPNDPATRGDVVLPDPVVGREPLVRGPHDFHAVTEMVCRVNEALILDTPKPNMANTEPQMPGPSQMR